MNTIAGAAITSKKAAEPEFIEYAQATLRNAKALAAALLAEGVTLITGGTDNHLLVIDTVASFGLDGQAAEVALDAVGITTNKQIIPDDTRPPLRPSGLRLGTPTCTTRGNEGPPGRPCGLQPIAAAMRSRSGPPHPAERETFDLTTRRRAGTHRRVYEATLKRDRRVAEGRKHARAMRAARPQIL